MEGPHAELLNQVGDRIARESATLNGLFDAVGATTPCLALDEKGCIRFVSSSLLRIMDKDGAAESYLGQTAGYFFKGDDQAQTCSVQAMQARAVQQCDMDVTTQHGEERLLRVFSTPLLAGAQAIGAFTMYMDVTTERDQAKVLEEQEAKINRISEDALNIARSVFKASQSLATIVENANRGADAQNDRANETATTMNEMNATVMEVSRSASEAASLASDSSDKSSEGAGVVKRLTDLIMQVDDAVATLGSRVTTLGQEAEGINQVITVINDIADQTNLLALNAAIEAARAGEHGRGFVVVADEVRKLAEKTMSATKEVGQTITSIQNSAGQAAREMESATAVVKEVTGSAAALRPMAR